MKRQNLGPGIRHTEKKKGQFLQYYFVFSAISSGNVQGGKPGLNGAGTERTNLVGAAKRMNVWLDDLATTPLNH